MVRVKKYQEMRVIYIYTHPSPPYIQFDGRSLGLLKAIPSSSRCVPIPSSDRLRVSLETAERICIRFLEHTPKYLGKTEITKATNFFQKRKDGFYLRLPHLSYPAPDQDNTDEPHGSKHIKMRTSEGVTHFRGIFALTGCLLLSILHSNHRQSLGNVCN